MDVYNRVISEYKPFALSVPPRVPLALMDKNKAELTRMEKLVVISRIDEPTEWCAGMIVVPKSGGQGIWLFGPPWGPEAGENIGKLSYLNLPDIGFTLFTPIKGRIESYCIYL